MIRVNSVTFCYMYTADKLESGNKIVAREKVRKNENLEIVTTLIQ